MTPLILPAIIAFYRARGFRFVTVSDLFGLAGPHPAKVAATPKPSASARPAAHGSPAAPPTQPPAAAAPGVDSAAPASGAVAGAVAPAATTPDLPGGADILPELALLSVASAVAVGLGATRRLRSSRG